MWSLDLAHKLYAELPSNIPPRLSYLIKFVEIDIRRLKNARIVS